MKRPGKIIKWLPTESERNGVFVDYNGKPAYRYFVTIPYWLIRAFKKPSYVKVEISGKLPCFADRQKDEDHDNTMAYFSRNWHKKMAKMRKLNSNYLLVATEALGKGWFQSIEDYNNYHKELRELNKKYGLETAMQREGGAEKR